METAMSLPVVFARDGKVFANSRDVARCFEKRHDHVLRDIDQILTHSSDLRHGSDLSHGPNLGHAPDLGDGYFSVVATAHPTVRGRMDRAYDMTRDGFTLLAMGFTGSKALQWKLKYIAAFNMMEADIRARLASSPRMEEIERMNTYVGAVAEVRRNYGRASARAMWEMLPLPQVKKIEPHFPRGEEIDPEDDGAECLAHLLRHAAGNGGTIGNLISLAFGDRTARARLEGMGVKVIDGGKPRFAIAEKHAALAELFAGTPWMDDWYLPLLALDGAVSRLTQFGDGGQMRAVQLPKAMLATVKRAN